jgi:DNA-binding transcriptional LysR family regulator
MGEFKSKYPNVRPRLIVANSEAIETRVSEHTLDIGFIESPTHQPNLQTEVCCEDEMQVICSPKFPLARLKEITPQALADHPFVSREPGSGTREFTEVYLHKHGIDIDHIAPVMELGSPQALLEVVETGLGYAIASRSSVLQALRLGDLVSIPLKPRLVRKLSMVYPKEKFRSRLVTAFVTFATERLKDHKAR